MFVLFVISFILAIRSLSKLEIPVEVIQKIERGERTPAIWGVILFLKGKTVHYSSSKSSESSVSSSLTPSVPSTGASSSNKPSRISDRIEA